MGKAPSRHPSRPDARGPREHDVRVPRTRLAVIALVVGPLLTVLGAGCGSGDGATKPAAPSTSRPPTHATTLSVKGVATAPTADPATEAAKVPFSGTVDCPAGHPSGTGMFATNAAAVCAEIVARREVLARVGSEPGRMCSEIYGGPQQARITGTVAGTPVSIRVSRSDGCGIADWTTLQWLLGPPER